MAGDHPMSLRNYLTKVVKLWCPKMNEPEFINHYGLSVMWGVMGWKQRIQVVMMSN